MHCEVGVSGWTAYPTRRGDGWIRWDGRDRLVELGLPGADLPSGPPASPPVRLRELATALGRYWRGQAPLPPLPEDAAPHVASDLRGTIYRIVAAIPAGTTRTYAEVARLAGRPGAARAVGAAMAENPLAPLIPCHRVVGSDGSLRGYAGGVDMKRALIDMEASGA